MGPHTGQGTSVLHGYGHDERTWSQPGFQQFIEHGLVWTVNEATRRSWQQLKMPDVTYIDGFNVPNYENRDPVHRSIQMPFSPEDAMKFIQIAGRVPAGALRQRARHHQAHHVLRSMSAAGSG